MVIGLVQNNFVDRQTNKICLILVTFVIMAVSILGQIAIAG